MLIETAEQLLFIAQEKGIDGVSLRAKYSGRGMMKESTAAIIVPDLMTLGYLSASALQHLYESDDLDDSSDSLSQIDTFVESLKTLQWDAMGKSYVIY